MRTIVYSLLAAVSGVVLLFSYRASVADVAAADPVPAETPAAAQTVVPGKAAPTAPLAASSAPSAPVATDSTTGMQDGTYTGTVAATRFGPVQVAVTVTGGTIADVRMLQQPDSNGRDQQINARAIPILIRETTSAQSAAIDMVSGATYTSRGYVASLQSALDQARL